ncbi:MAG TPA: aromatic ring-hydroxylating dioxygenase subunit alpha [Caldimonas sp.]|jgi:p-cumate 2,3-dioxygenase alpha subunit|nr:aromatic ring-hydroxylating dioxygenase subunit alpha [Caldimonas sp.]HEX2540361.1 aromatic ring-hydroxylating dioxygenase subunit alpha [Caldimonas sp.]
MKRDPDFDWAIVDDREKGIFRVNRRVFTEDAVFEAERRAIFERCWLYAAHESEVAASGAFVTRQVGGLPLIINRDRAGSIHAFFNSCPHRGAMVCREAKGKARSFTCPYHGWVFADDGRTINRPLPDSYTAACVEDPTLNLRPVPRFESFAGFLFVNYSPVSDGIGSLADYLGGAGDYLKMIAEQDRDGMVIVGGAQTYSARANWKLLQENSADGYHAATTHSTYFDYIRNREGSVLDNFGKGFGRVRNLGNGHAVSESVDGTPWGRPLARPMASFSDEIKDAMAAARSELEARVGKERGEFICRSDRNMLIFPNLVVNDIMGLTVRTYAPVSPGYFEVNAWALAPKNEAPILRELRLKNYLEFLGPAGFATPDDQEMLELCQRAYATNRFVEWNDLSRGMRTEESPAPAKQDELQMRTFWRRWKELMSASEGALA